MHIFCDASLSRICAPIAFFALSLNQRHRASDNLIRSYLDEGTTTPSIIKLLDDGYGKIKLVRLSGIVWYKNGILKSIYAP